MKIKTILAYLFGSREAILSIAACRNSIWVGLLLVLSAGLAREYDGEDLLHEPWHLLLPLGASLVSSLVLGAAIYAVARRRRCRDLGFLRFYRSFLGLYWMTAPLAWLYAIPVEELLSPAAATRVNLWLLALVSAWRVLLITRAISVLLNANALAVLMIVMCFADTVALQLLIVTPLPILSLMGGVRLSESESILQGAAFLVGFFGAITWPVWAIGTLWVLASKHPPWEFEVSPSLNPATSRPLWAFAAASLVAWVFVLPITQPKQQLRGHAERLLKQGDVADGLAFMSARRREDFPPHWDPPPRVAYHQRYPRLVDVIAAIDSAPADSWVRAVYVEKLRSYLQGLRWRFYEHDDELSRLISLLETLPEGPQIALDARHELGSFPEEDPLHARVQKLLSRANDESTPAEP